MHCTLGVGWQSLLSSVQLQFYTNFKTVACGAVFPVPLRVLLVTQQQTPGMPFLLQGSVNCKSTKDTLRSSVHIILPINHSLWGQSSKQLLNPDGPTVSDCHDLHLLGSSSEDDIILQILVAYWTENLLKKLEKLTRKGSSHYPVSQHLKHVFTHCLLKF